MYSASEDAFTSEVEIMAEAGENFAAFNSRALVEMVGGVTDEALKATRIKKFLGQFLQADISIGLGANHCLRSIWESSAVLLRWQLQQPLVLMETDLVFCSVHLLDNPMFFSSMDQSVRNSLTKLSVYGSKCLSQSTALQWANVQFLADLTSNPTIFSKALTR